MHNERRARRCRLVATATAALFLHTCLWAVAPREIHARSRGQLPKVMLIPLQHAEDVRSLTAQRIQDYLRTLLAMSGLMELQQPTEIIATRLEAAALEEQERKQAPTPIATADELLWQGKDDLANREYKVAMSRLREVVQLYRDNYEQLVDYDKMVDAHLHLAMAYYRSGHDHRGEEALTNVIVMRPEIVIDPRQFSIGLRDAAERIKDRLRAIETGQVVVDSTPSGRVYLNGVMQGGTPQTLSGLFDGEHYVQVRAEGHEHWAKRVDAPRPGALTQLTADLTPHDREAPQIQHPQLPEQAEALVNAVVEALESGELHDDFGSKAYALAEFAGSDYLLMGYLSRDEDDTFLSPFLYSKSAGQTAALEELVFDRQLTNLQVNLLLLDDRLAEAFEHFPTDRRITARPKAYERRPPPVVAAPPPPPEPEPEPEPEPPAEVAKPTPAPPTVAPMYDPTAPIYDPTAPVYDPSPAPVRDAAAPPDRDASGAWYRQWWVWTIVGAVVVGGAVTAGVLLAPGETSDRFSVQVTW